MLIAGSRGRRLKDEIKMVEAPAAWQKAPLSIMGRAAPHATQTLSPQTPGGVKLCAFKSRGCSHPLNCSHGELSSYAWLETTHEEGQLGIRGHGMTTVNTKVALQAHWTPGES